jgi:hypothetical protein
MSAKQYDRVQHLSSFTGEAPQETETLDYIAQMSIALRAMALDAGCLTLAAVLDVAQKEAQLQLLRRSSGLGKIP